VQKFASFPELKAPNYRHRSKIFIQFLAPRMFLGDSPHLGSAITTYTNFRWACQMSAKSVDWRLKLVWRNWEK